LSSTALPVKITPFFQDASAGQETTGHFNKTKTSDSMESTSDDVIPCGQQEIVKPSVVVHCIANGKVDNMECLRDDMKKVCFQPVMGPKLFTIFGTAFFVCFFLRLVRHV
jgi:hypothetical protein